MTRHQQFARSLVSGGFILALSSGAVFATEPAARDLSSPASEWFIGIVDGTREVGYNVSVATDPVTGDMYISYYEGNDGDLWLARTGAPTGNCGPNNAWECQVVDSAGVVGKYSSIAVGGSGPVASLYISYHDVTNGSLKVIEGGVTRATGVLTYSSYVVESGNPAGSVYRGTATSVTLAGDGTPHIGYQVNTFASQEVWHAVRVSPGSGNCGAAAGDDWECSSVHVDAGIGGYIDIDVGPGGVTNIAFSTTMGTNTYPMIAIEVTWAGTCSADGWTCWSIEHPGEDTGDYLSFEIANDGIKHLVYRNATTESLEWAFYADPNGNCGPFQAYFQCEWIDDIGPGTSPAGIDMKTDSDGDPIIAYQDLESGYEDLKIARPVGGLPGSGGNCGPLSAFMEHMWLCETLEEGNLSHSEAYGGLSVALNANDEAAVAYRELWGAPPTDPRLKIALEPISIFLDGFETGNTSRWSAVVP
jgi:hypothetical protein